MPYINRVTLLGTIGREGISLRYATSGSPCASFVLVLEERGQDQKMHQLFVPVEVWGKKAESAAECEAGALCLIEGRLAKRRQGERWELLISSFELQPLSAQALASAKEN